jgi:hypothetical protein
MKLTEEEWQQACFCVDLYGFGDSVSIINKWAECVNKKEIKENDKIRVDWKIEK